MSATIQDVLAKSFDYVIVGAGAAGLTLAATLTEDPNTTVLILEAGPANLNDPDILRLASYGSHFSNDRYAWTHTTVKQKNANDKAHTWHRGKGIGGSTAINFLGYTKPPKQEINDLERLGNPGWNWDVFQKAMQRVEGFIEPSEAVREKFGINIDPARQIGRDGPLKIAYPGLMNEPDIQVKQTLINAGFPVAPEPLSGDPRGVFFTPNTIDPLTYTRSYAATAFYLPNKDRPNFHVLVDALAHRVEMETVSTGGLKATGVTFAYDGKTYLAHANREVILSAGALRSPQLLELSGIGRRDVLENIGVPVKYELPGVGENMQEHMFTGVSWELKEDVKYETLDLLRDPVQFAKNLELLEKGEGLFTLGASAFAFVPPHIFTPRAEELYQKAVKIYADVDGAANPGLKVQYEIMKERMEVDTPRSGPGCEFNVVPGMASYPNQPEPGKRYMTLVTAVNYMWSRGTVHCTSDDPRQDPEIDPHYFEHDIDIDIFMECVKFARSVAKIAPLKDMIVKELNPGPDVQTNEHLANWLKEVSTTEWHSAGTCSMLPEKHGGVTDARFKVYGTANLRVVDLSALPLHIAAHSQATVYGMASRAAEIIKEDTATSKA